MNNNSTYSNLINAIVYPALIINTKANIIYANNLFVSKYGDTQNRIYDIDNLFDNSNLEQMLLDTFKDKQNRKIHQSINYLDIKLQEYEIQISYIEDSQDNYLVTIVDISDLTHHKRNFNLLFEHSQATIAIVDTDYHIIRANQKFRIIFGDNYKLTLPEIYKRRKSEIPNMPVNRCFKTGKPHILPQNAITLNGAKINLLSTALPFSFENGKPTSVIEICTDITEINKMQEQLNSVNDNFLTILNVCTEGLLVIHNHEKISIMNKKAREILGFAQQRKPGANIIKSILPENVFTMEQYSEQDVKLETPDGRMFNIDIATLKLSDNEGQLIVLKENNSRQPKSSIAEKLILRNGEANEIIQKLVFRTLEKRTSILKEMAKEIEENVIRPNKYYFEILNNLNIVYDFTLKTFIQQIKSISQKRTNIKIITLINRLQNNIKIIKKTLKIDVLIIQEYTPTISINTDALLNCLLTLLYGSAGDISTNQALKGTVKLRFTCDDNAQPYIMLEDNYMETENEMSETDLLALSLLTTTPLLQHIKCKVEHSSTPFLGRKVKITLP